MGKVLVFKFARERQQSPPRKVGVVDWVRLALAHVLGAVEFRPRWWDGNTLDALNERMLRDVGLTRDEFNAVRGVDHRLVAPAPPDLLSRPGPAAMLDVAGRPTPYAGGRRW